MKIPLSIVIHSKNEELNLPYTLDSVVEWADQIFLVDSESTDKTQEIARRYGLEIYSRPCTREILVEQRNWALDILPFRHEWVLILDADEVLESDLKQEIAQIISNNPQNIDGYWCRFKVIFQHKWIKRSSMYPSWSLRLFRHKKVRYEKREVNSHPLLAPERAGYLKGHLLNWDRKGFSAYVQRMDGFSSTEAKAYAKILNKVSLENQIKPRLFGARSERRRYLKNLFINFPLRPLVIFVYLYIIRMGFLDGRAGFDYVFYRTVIEWMISVKIRENRRIEDEKRFRTA